MAAQRGITISVFHGYTHADRRTSGGLLVMKLTAIHRTGLNTYGQKTPNFQQLPETLLTACMLLPCS